MLVFLHPSNPVLVIMPSARTVSAAARRPGAAVCRPYAARVLPMCRVPVTDDSCGFPRGGRPPSLPMIPMLPTVPRDYTDAHRPPPPPNTAHRLVRLVAATYSTASRRRTAASPCRSPRDCRAAAATSLVRLRLSSPVVVSRPFSSCPPAASLAAFPCNHP